MAGKLFICIIIALALIQPFYTLPAAESQRGEYYPGDGIIVSQDPIYWRPNNVKSPINEHVVIVEPTITYSRQAEYHVGQPVTFKSSQTEKESDFKPYDGRSDGQVAYYPYYFRSSSSDRNDIEESSRGSVASDTAYQRFVPRGQNEVTYYYENRPVQREAPAPAPATVSSKSSVRFYYPNGTAVRTYYNEDNQQVMDIHPNQYVIQVAETTTSTTTKRPDPTTQEPIYYRTDIDCPPYSPCNAVVYQPPSPCCKCYVVQSRCCPCNYSPSRKN